MVFHVTPINRAFLELMKPDEDRYWDLKRDSKSVEAYFRAAAKDKTKSKLVVSSEWYGMSVGSDVF